MERLRDYIRTGQVHRLRDEAQAGREPLPPGEYELELYDAVWLEGRETDVLSIEWRVAVGSGPHAGRRIYQSLRFYGGGISYAVADAKLLGIEIGALDSLSLPPLEPDPKFPDVGRYRAPVPRGLVALAELEHWQGNKGTRHQVKRLIKVLRPAPDLGGLALMPPAASPADGEDNDGDIPF
jgi:hypothetical protein